MVKFDVRPAVTLSNGGKDVAVAVNVLFAHKDNDVTVRVADTMFKDGGNGLNGLSVEVKNERFELAYDLGNHAPALRMNTHVNAGDKRVDLIYRRALKAGDTSLEGSVGVDDNNTAAIVYNLTNFDKPDYRNCTFKWTHVRDDLELTPAYNMGTESLSVTASYRVDDENKLKLKYDMNDNMGSLEWTNSAGTGGGGDLRVTARANLADADAAKQVPTLLIEKTWTVDN